MSEQDCRDWFKVHPPEADLLSVWVFDYLHEGSSVFFAVIMQDNEYRERQEEALVFEDAWTTRGEAQDQGEKWLERYRHTDDYLIKRKLMGWRISDPRSDHPTPEEIAAQAAADAAAAPEGVTVIKERAARGGRGRQTLFGHPISKILSVMGLMGMDWRRAKAALIRLDIEAPDNTVKTFIYGAGRADVSKLPSLTQEQLASLQKE